MKLKCWVGVHPGPASSLLALLNPIEQRVVFPMLKTGYRSVSYLSGSFKKQKLMGEEEKCLLVPTFGR